MPRRAAAHQPLSRAPDRAVGYERSNASCELLMVRYQRGHHEAFAELIRRHATRLYNYTLRNLGDRGAADEVACQVFMQVVHRAPEFKHEGRFSTWLYALAHDEIARELETGRRLDGRRPAAAEQAAEAQLIDTDSPEESRVRAAIAPLYGPAGGASQTPAGDATLALVMGLPLDQRQVFLLREVANLPFADIAQVTGSSESDVKSAMRAVLERLRAALSETEAYARELK